MIDVVFQGRVKNRKIIEEFVNEIINELFPREFKRDIVIGIRFVTMLKSGHDYGQATYGDTDYHLIEVAKYVHQDDDWIRCTTQEIAATIVHEMVHIRQYIRRELNAEMTRWKGQVIPYGPRGGLKIPYERQPWEVEAFRIEKEVMETLWVH